MGEFRWLLRLESQRILFGLHHDNYDSVRRVVPDQSHIIQSGGWTGSFIVGDCTHRWWTDAF